MVFVLHPCQVSAVADSGKYECSTAPIRFRPTMMFQTRSFNFPLHNKGLGALPFSWTVLHRDGTPDESGEDTLHTACPNHSCMQHCSHKPQPLHSIQECIATTWLCCRPGLVGTCEAWPALRVISHITWVLAAVVGLYAVEPVSGVIPGGSSTQILLRFSPREVEDVGRVIRADFVGLDAAQQPLQIDVDGKVGTGHRLESPHAVLLCWHTSSQPLHVPALTVCSPNIPLRHQPGVCGWQVLLLTVVSVCVWLCGCRSCAPGATLSCQRATTSVVGAATLSSLGPPALLSLWTQPPR